MAAEPKRIRADHDTKLEPILEEAASQPLIVELNGNAYRINAELVSSSPFSAEAAYASVRTVDGRTGAEVSDEELANIIKDAREDYADYLVGKYKSHNEAD